MPARSDAQRKYLYARFGAEWVRRHHFDTPGRLPRHVDAKARKGGRTLRDASRRKSAR
jgi:hypothetical protein